MAREFARAFYDSADWKRCRESYIQKMPKEKRGLCELCYAKGKHVLGEELHHKIWLNEKNIKDRNVTLNHKNLILLCFDCHQRVHGKRNDRRYKFDKDGNIIAP